MNHTMVSENHVLLERILRPIIRALRTAYIQGTSVVKLMKSDRAIKLYYKYRCQSYDLQWSMDPGYRKGLARLVQLAVNPSDRVLDVGCGTGSATLRAAGLAREVVGIDLSPHMIKLAREKTAKDGITNTAFVAAKVEDYAPEKPFDKVISSFMICHLPQELRPSIYSCMFNFLKPGGRVALFGSRGEVCNVYETRDQVETNLRRAGFADIEIIDLYDIYRIATARRPSDESAPR
ncbi:MAG: methyltransferase domain-containing protein [Thermodesulfobacteriota bacterium]